MSDESEVRKEETMPVDDWVPVDTADDPFAGLANFIENNDGEQAEAVLVEPQAEENSQGSGASSGMGSFVDASADAGSEGRGDFQDTSPSIVMVEEEETVFVVQAAEVERTGAVEEAKEAEETQIEEKVVSVVEELSSYGVDESNQEETRAEAPVAEEPQVAPVVVEEPQTESPVVVEEPQTESPVVVEEPQTEALVAVEEPQTEALVAVEEPQVEAPVTAPVSPRSRNHRVKHLKLRQKYQSSSADGENLAFDMIPSTLTSASQVTAVHGNTSGNDLTRVENALTVAENAITGAHSNESTFSGISSFGTEEIISTPISESPPMEEKDRLRLKVIALETVKQEGETVKEAQDLLKSEPERRNPFEEVVNDASKFFDGVRGDAAKFTDGLVSDASKFTAQFDTFGEKAPASTASELEMKSVDRGTNYVNATPAAQANIIKSGSAESGSSNTSEAPTQTSFVPLPPMKAASGNFVDIGRLIVVGVLGLVGGVMASFFALTTCEFVVIKKSVGYYGEYLYMHAGMSEFTSIDSAFQGHSTCMSYDNDYYEASGPAFAKASGTAALIFGLTSVTILWFFNLTSRTTEDAWNVATCLAGAAAFFQLCTLQFFFGTVCKESSCGLSTGSWVSLLSACSYAYMAFEMNRNTPVRRTIPEMASMVGDLIAKETSIVGGRLAKEKETYFPSQNLAKENYSAPELV